VFEIEGREKMTLFTKERNLLLAIESSCDETSVAVIEDGKHILANIVALTGEKSSTLWRCGAGSSQSPSRRRNYIMY
jgi:hypothetical protein